MRPEYLTALEFAQGVDDVRDAAELHRRFREVVARFGIKYFATSIVAMPGQMLRPRFLFGEVKEEWTQHYVQHGYAQQDPIVSAMFETRKPFTWTEAAARRPTKEAQRLFGEVAEITGAREGLVIPIHGVRGETSAVVLSGPQLEFAPEDRPILHLASVYFSSVGRDLFEAEAPPEVCPLTGRQLECLRWVMDGKSDWEIGEILSISERTAHNHIEAAKRMLAVGTRTQAFVHALRRGWLV